MQIPLLSGPSRSGKGTSGLAQRMVVAASVAAALMVLCMMAMPDHHPVELRQRLTRAVLAQETKHVEHTNKRLEEEDKELALMAQKAEAEVMAKQQSQALSQEQRRMQNLRRQNAQLELANQQMKQKMLATKAQLERAQIAAMQSEIRSGTIMKVADGAQSLHSKPTAVSPLMQLHKAQAQVKHAKTKTHMLAGQYVKACEDGRGCHMAYVHEDEEDWQSKNHTHLVTQNGMGYPLGPTIRVPVDDFSTPLRDVLPGMSPLGENKLGFGDHDHYVKWEHSALNPDLLLPPWRHNDSEVDEAEGLPEVKGFNDTREVFEATPFSGTLQKDWRQINLEVKGVNVDSWGKGWGMKHKWDRAGVDHWPNGPPAPKAVEWGKLENPQWSWDNHAMKHLGWNPEGKLNKDLMLGVGWNDTEGFLDDNFAGKHEYAHHLEPHHGFVLSHEDHFADWEANSTKNLRLLYGDSEVSRSMVWHPHLKLWTRDQWGLGDTPIAADKAAKQLHLRASLQRTGEPFTDALTRQWSGANMVATTANNFKGTQVEVEDSSPTEPTKLEKLGVNV